MFLLGRARATLLLHLRLRRPQLLTVRQKGNATAKMKPKDRSKTAMKDVPRDAMGRPIIKARERSLPTFRAMPPTALTHELFEPASEGPGRLEFDLPPLRGGAGTGLAPGVVTKFDDRDPSAPHRAFGVPRRLLLEFRVLGTPLSVTTHTTLALIQSLHSSLLSPSRLVLNGRPGVGKSFALLQAASYAASTSEWLVLYIPRARALVDASSPYSYSLSTRTYHQPKAARELLRRTDRANHHILQHLSTSAPITLASGEVVPEGTMLPEVVSLGLADPENAQVLLEGLVDSMASQNVFPLLIAVDDFQALTGTSFYRDPVYFRPIRPWHLGVPRLLLEYASGRRQIAKGIFLGALTTSDTQFTVTPQLAAALDLPADFLPSPHPYAHPHAFADGRDQGTVGKVGRSSRWSRQLAAYLEHEVDEVPPIEDEYAEEGIAEYEEGMEGEYAAEEGERSKEGDIDAAATAQGEQKHTSADSTAETDARPAADAESLDGSVEHEQQQSEEAYDSLSAESSTDPFAEYQPESAPSVEYVEEAPARTEWTGWRAYDAPFFEDELQATLATPEPRHPDPERGGRWAAVGEAEATSDSKSSLNVRRGQGVLMLVSA
ncbi:mitochondrial ribosomal death-associated protein 3-domain-containing protein [Mycena maculata]|uniref:Small ribosomal subunit protein mS29 n=1 Tax=Mycena maculata TaxID=230809 RepID=A0AAD7KEC9_9AGAR|nr:mitochondrial ribosomal death-associated protein 3-domain-containing protein [Mycena maculata]